MTRPVIILAVAGALAVNSTAQNTPTKDQQIAAATLPLPEAYRAGATVQSVSADFKTTELRKGTTSMVCTIIRPGSENFFAHCFDQDYEALGRRAAELHQELVKEGKPADGAAVLAALKKETDAGKIKVPTHSAVGFQMRGPDKAFDWTTNTPSKEIKHWEMVMIPYATGASLALPNKRPADSGPWVMNEGTAEAHIMIEH